MWHVPATRTRVVSDALRGLAQGVALIDQSGDAAVALPMLTARELSGTDVADYARFYEGLALQRLNRLDAAEVAFAAVAGASVEAQLPEAAMFKLAEVRALRGDMTGAAALYERLLSRTIAAPQLALVRLGPAAAAAGDVPRARAALRRLLREHPLSPEALEGEQALAGLDGFVLDTPAAIAEEMGRGETLFKARRFDQARGAYERVRHRVEGIDRDRVVMRLAQVQAAKGQHSASREVFRRYAGHDVFGMEAQYGLVVATRAHGRLDDYRQAAESFVQRHPSTAQAEEALNELARLYVLADEDAKAAAVYARMVAGYPQGAFAERAAWRAGWWAYREKQFEEAVRLFERGAASFPRSDYRPSWLYWSARAYDQIGATTAATARYRLTATDYRNSYYGRLAWTALERLNDAGALTPVRQPAVTPARVPPPNIGRVARLIDLELYRPALDEIQYAQTVWRDSPALQATAALVQNRLGNLRLGINAMKRAYPQYMAAGGEALPSEILQVIFPIDYWPLLKGHAQAYGLDPFLVGALVAQESTFDAAIRSSANAIGLMQILPSTGRQLARQMSVKTYSERSLTNPEVNVRLGTRYYSDLYKQFGAHAYALAGYNAGAHRVKRWLAEAPGVPIDEWVDNIPFAETQNYVKRILGTAEDYRRLYGDLVPAAPTSARGPAATPAAPAVGAAPPTKKAPPRQPATRRPAPKRAPRG